MPHSITALVWITRLASLAFVVGVALAIFALPPSEFEAHGAGQWLHCSPLWGVALAFVAVVVGAVADDRACEIRDLRIRHQPFNHGSE